VRRAPALVTMLPAGLAVESTGEDDDLERRRLGIGASRDLCYSRAPVAK